MSSFLNASLVKQASSTLPPSLRVDLSYVHAVYHHFAPHIITPELSIESTTPDRILMVIRIFMDTFEIKKSAFLEAVPTYAESTNGANSKEFFRSIVKECIGGLRSSPLIVAAVGPKEEAAA